MDNYPSQEQIEKWHNDPNNWKLGLFYFNKEDNPFWLIKNRSGWEQLSISPIENHITFYWQQLAFSDLSFT
jgi:hypothetical protein